MRFVRTFGLTMAAVATLAATPALAGKMPRPLTLEDSVECMVVTLPFYLAATANSPDDVERYDAIGTYWAQKGDSFGQPSDAEMEGIKGQFDVIIADFSALESDAEIPAFLAPYQAKFDACETMRKDMQG